MEKVTDIWYRRRAEYWTMSMRYWRLIGKNSGIMFVLYLLFIVGSIYYKKWLDHLPAQFPGGLIIALLVGILVIHTPLRTFTQDPDLVFLLPLEAKLKAYFSKSQQYNFLLQSVMVVALIIVLSPLYMTTVRSTGAPLFVFICLAVILKLLNVISHWHELYFNTGQFILKAFRLIASFLTLYVFLSGHILAGFGVLLLFMAGIHLIYYRPAKDHLLDWDRLVELDKKQLRKLFRFANLFTDVPALKDRVHQRQWLSKAVNVIPIRQENLYTRYFALTFIRASDYFGLWFRLSVVGIVLMIGYHTGYATYIIAAATVYLTGLQIMPLWQHSAPAATFHLYPVPYHLKKKGFLNVMSAVLLGQAGILSIIGALLIGSTVSLLIFLGITLGTTGLFVGTVVKKRLRQKVNTI